MWWKIYFWIIFAITAFDLVITTPLISSFEIAVWKVIIEDIIIVLGLYAYVFDKRMFSTNIWRYIFIGTIISFAVNLIYKQIKLPQLNFLESNVMPSTASFGVMVVSIIILMPAFYAIYRLGFSAKKKK